MEWIQMNVKILKLIDHYTIIIFVTYLFALTRCEGQFDDIFDHKNRKKHNFDNVVWFV